MHFPPTDLRCHGNEIWDKICYTSACVRDFCITACAVATSCCISDVPSQWEGRNFDPPQLPHFSTDLNETWNQKRYPGYDPTRKIWLMWDDGKEVCVGRAFSVTFCVLSIYLSFFCILAHTYRSHQRNRSRPFMAQNACFGVM